MKNMCPVLFFLFVAGNCFGQQVAFQKIYSFPGGIVGLSGIQTTDGGYIITGGTMSSGTVNGDVYIIKVDSLGNTLWTKIYGGVNVEYAYSIKETFDRGFILAGSIEAANTDISLLKIDSLGNLEWWKKYGSNQNDYGRCVEQTSDSGYVVIGYTLKAIPCCRDDIYVIKTDNAGNLIWNKSYHGYDGIEYGMSIQQTADGGYILSGGKDSTGVPNFLIWLIKIDSAGNQIWTRVYGAGRGNSVRQTSDGGYVITGYMKVTPVVYGVILVKTDSIGNLQWEKLFQRNSSISFGNSVKQTSDGGFIITGQTGNFGFGSNDVLLFKTDINGDSLWTRYYGNISEEQGMEVQQTGDGGYAIFGFTDNFGIGDRNIYLIKTDSNGISNCNLKNFVFDVISLAIDSTPWSTVTTFLTSVSTPAFISDTGGTTTTLCTTVGIQSEIRNSKSEINISPNPATANFTITFPHIINKGVIEIYNVLGEKVREETVFNASAKEIRLKDIPSGIYFVKVNEGVKEYADKIVITD